MLVYLVIDDRHTALPGRHRRFQWTVISFLKYFDITDNSCLFSQLGQLVLNLENEASRVGVKINTGKVFSLVGQRFFPICSNGQNIKDVDQFVYPAGCCWKDRNHVYLVDSWCHVNGLSINPTTNCTNRNDVKHKEILLFC